MSNVFVVSGSPHVHGDYSVKKIMWGVVLALVPAMLVSFWYFGIGAISITLVAVSSCLFFEYVIQKYFLKQEVTVSDGSAVITGVLLAFNVPSNLPIWMMIIGSFVAIVIAKMSYGGLGKNPFNPALIGRVFLLIAFPVDMTSWPLPIVNRTVLCDAVTGPTSLGILKEGISKGESVSTLASNLPAYTDLFIGNMGGSLGEVSAIALIIGGLYMLFKKIITWHIPVSYILTVFVFTGILNLVNPEIYIDPVFHLLTGGLMLGAIFMATDMVTSPMSYKGMLVFGIGCGVLTALIRIWGAYPEGVSFAILIMNTTVPLINKGFKPKQFGEVNK
ncbi:MAG: Na+-transporting NADH:ubiquinone oxidoreductase subunit D [Bacteroidetes bacterium GWE2_29_8]|nr:MAG: Na+-transporting NADH:ubiquinone oxidoreductase subunit D [Bacteroidetes bacterium GWE2_29_8]OFY21312.1 MAG: Na+-transporting NADH:ubiquinone oxidoreductase subunit D [Bacteroidetes bacterium GWF2_29_10]